MGRRTIRTSVVLMLGLGLAWALLWSLGDGPRPVQAQGPDGYSVYYVAPGGDCGGATPCYASVQGAVDAADDPGDVVKVAGGTYSGVEGRPAPAGYGNPPASGTITQVVYLSKTLTLQGGYAPADWAVPDPDLNPTTLDAMGEGRVLLIAGSISPTIAGLRLTGGNADGLGGQAFGGADSGGGVYIHDASGTLRDNVIWGNLAPGWDASGGGIFMWSSDAVVRDNVIHDNEACYGGGLHAEESTVTIEDNLVHHNRATLKGGGLSIFTGASVVRRNEVYLNDADWEGGGFYISQDSSTLSANRVYSNTAQLGAGWHLILSPAVLERNQTFGNTAWNEGGGFYLRSSDATLTNNLVADNWASVRGSGLMIIRASPSLRHTTIADNVGGDESGLHVTDAEGVFSHPTLQNTIVSGQAIGVYLWAGNTATFDGTLWHDNGTNWIGTTVRSNDRLGDPDFVDLPGGDYHLGPASAAIDGGHDAGVTVDIDGEPRPSGTGYDLGADERLDAARYNLDLRVGASSDDAEERAAGWTTVTGDDLELVDDAGNLQTVGIRFDGVSIPPGMQIVNAYLQFESDAIGADPASLQIEGEASDDAATFANGWNMVTSRPRTLASVFWSPLPWPAVGAQDLEQRTPDLSAVVQEVVDRVGWVAGNALSFIFSGWGRRVAESYDGDAAAAPLLHIEYVEPPPTTCWARINDDPVEYTTVQAAVDAASEGDLVKVAGYCLGAFERDGSYQQVYLDKSLTIRGGYGPDDWSTSDPLAYPTTLDAMGQGSVFNVTTNITTTLESLSITNGTGWGGGIYVGGGGRTTISNTIVISNAGNGIALIAPTAAVVHGSTIVGNAEDGINLEHGNLILEQNVISGNLQSGVRTYGGQATLHDNTVEANASGGVYINQGAATLTHNRVISNAQYGIHVYSGPVAIQGNEILYNTGYSGAGIQAGYSDSLLIEGNTILYNVASSSGGGVYSNQSALTMINNVIADNQAGEQGSGLLIYSWCSSANLAHNMFARNSGGDGSGIHIVGDPSCVGTFMIANTIFVSHTVGITVSDGNTAYLDGTLWGSGAWANGTDWAGDGTILTGTVNLWGDPAFVDPDGGDYHIGLGSAALNAGVDAGTTTDIDAEPRPMGGGYEIGADEVYQAPAPQAISDLSGTRSGSDLLLDWTPVTQDVLGNPLTPDHYVVYRRANEPYFSPMPGDAIATPAAPPYIDVGALGDPAHNYSYVVTAVSGDGVESEPSNRVGVFSFALVPPAAPGQRSYNLIAVNLELPGVTDADSLAAYIGPGVYMVLRHDAPTQEIVWRLPGLAGTNFPVTVGDAVYLYLDETAPDVVSLVGGVPAIGAVSFALTPADPGGSCAYHFISVPLDRDDLLDADALAADIGGVYTVSRYDAATQELIWRMPGGPGENFPVRAGYPYIVCLDESAPPLWP